MEAMEEGKRGSEPEEKEERSQEQKEESKEERSPQATRRLDASPETGCCSKLQAVARNARASGDCPLWRPAEVVYEQRRCAVCVWIVLLVIFASYSGYILYDAITADPPVAVKIVDPEPDEPKESYNVPGFFLCVLTDQGCASTKAPRYAPEDCVRQTSYAKAYVGTDPSEKDALYDVTKQDFTIKGEPAASYACWGILPQTEYTTSSFHLDVQVVWDSGYREANYASPTGSTPAIADASEPDGHFTGAFDSTAALYIETIPQDDGSSNYKLAAWVPLTIVTDRYTGAMTYTNTGVTLTRSLIKEVDGTSYMNYAAGVTEGSVYGEVQGLTQDIYAAGPPVNEGFAIASIYIAMDSTIPYLVYKESPLPWTVTASAIYSLWPVVVLIFGFIFSVRELNPRYLACTGDPATLPPTVHRDNLGISTFCCCAKRRPNLAEGPGTHGDGNSGSSDHHNGGEHSGHAEGVGQGEGSDSAMPEASTSNS